MRPHQGPAARAGKRRLMKLWKTVQGLHSLPKDCFAIYHRLSDGPWRRLPQSFFTYRADPFLLEWKGELWVLYEEFQYLTNKGRLGLCRIDGSDPQLLMDKPYHQSYPFPLIHQGRLYLLPESCANGTVDLYECEKFPQGWRLARRLLQGLDACDATLLFESERWWMFLAVRPAGVSQRHLEIYSSADLLQGAWEPHPINARRLYADLKNSSGRPGGAFFRHNHDWIRPAQYSPDYYGQGLSFRRLKTLTREHFEEEGVDLTGFPWRRNHHFHMLGDHQVINRKERMAYRNRPVPLVDAWLGA